MSNWISVKDRLPEQDGEVLVFSPKDKYTCVAWLDGMYWNYYGYTDICGNIGVRTEHINAVDTFTHWQPLPEPPEIKE